MATVSTWFQLLIQEQAYQLLASSRVISFTSDETDNST
jgi:hypothetical protein